MQLSFVLISLVAFSSSSIAAPTTRGTSLIARGRPIYDLLALEPFPHQEYRQFASFQEMVDYHLQVIKPDIDQDFDQWKGDMVSELQLYKAHLWSFPTERRIPSFEKMWNDTRLVSEATAAVASRKELGTDVAINRSKSAMEAHIMWIMKRLALLQTDIRPTLYKLLVEWSIVIHEGCNLKYTNYPTGLGAVLLQISTAAEWARNNSNPKCLQAIAPFYEEKLLNIYQTLLQPRYFSNLQLLCYAAIRGCEFVVGDVLPEVLSSKHPVDPAQ